MKGVAPQIIVIAGAPGSGKTTVTQLLHEHYQSVMIDFGWLRQFHLDRMWTRASKAEEAMAFENLTFILRNYLKHGYSHILLNDLEDQRVQQIPSLFEPRDFMIVTLTVNDETEHKQRVLNPERDSGYRDYQTAIAWNKAIQQRPLLVNEYRINNTRQTAEDACRQIIDLVGRHERSPNTRHQQ
jgi:chloramphenicol 3-O-phosphotransferase